MASADEVLIKIRTHGAKAAAADIQKAKKQLDGLGRSSRVRPGDRRTGLLPTLSAGLKGLPAQWRAGGAGATQFRRTLSGISGDVGRLTRGLAGTATSIAGIGGALTVAGGGAALGSFVKSGIQLNASFESARTSFGTLLGDMERGNTFIERLRDEISSKSPQRLTAVMGGAQQLIGQGMNEDQSVVTLGALDKAIIAMGKGEEEYALGARTLGQMWANGKASLQDVNQLSDGAGINVRKLLQEKLGLTGDQVADLGNQNVSSAAALWAITSGWEEQFSEAAKNAEQDWNVQTKQMVKDWEYFKRITTEGLFEDLSRNALPQVRKALTNVNNIMARQDIGFGEKLKLSWASAKTDLAPLWKDLKDGIGSLDIPRRLSEVFSEYGPRVAAFVAGTAAKGIEKGVPAAATAFWNAFKEMGLGGKLLTGTALLAWLRFPFWSAGTKLAGVLAKGLWGAGKSTLGTVGTKLGGTMLEAAGPRMKAVGGLLGKTLGLGLMAGAAAYVIANNKQISEWFGQNKDVTLSDGSVVDAMGQVRSVQRVKGGQQFGEGDLRTLAAMGRNQGRSEGEIAAQMDELRRRTEFRPRAAGGTVRAGEMTLVGERGPELLKLPAGSAVTSNRQARLQASGARGPRVVERVIREQPIHLLLDGQVFYRAMSRQTELVELRA